MNACFRVKRMAPPSPMVVFVSLTLRQLSPPGTELHHLLWWTSAIWRLGEYGRPWKPRKFLQLVQLEDMQCWLCKCCRTWGDRQVKGKFFMCGTCNYIWLIWVSTVRTLSDCTLSDYCTVLLFINIIVIISSIMIMNGFQADTCRRSPTMRGSGQSCWSKSLPSQEVKFDRLTLWHVLGHHNQPKTWHIHHNYGFKIGGKPNGNILTQKCPCRRFWSQNHKCKGMWLVVGRCLYIPCAFVTHFGKCIDEKTPLLRSMDAATWRDW